MRKRSFLNRLSIFSSIIVFSFITGCSLNVNNPNGPTQVQVLSSKEGITALAIGMQEYYATSAL